MLYLMASKMAEGEPDGLGWDVYSRLRSLKIIQASLEKDGDSYKQSSRPTDRASWVGILDW